MRRACRCARAWRQPLWVGGWGFRGGPGLLRRPLGLPVLAKLWSLGPHADVHTCLSLCSIGPGTCTAVCRTLQRSRAAAGQAPAPHTHSVLPPCRTAAEARGQPALRAVRRGAAGRRGHTGLPPRGGSRRARVLCQVQGQELQVAGAGVLDVWGRGFPAITLRAFVPPNLPVLPRCVSSPQPACTLRQPYGRQNQPTPRPCCLQAMPVGHRAGRGARCGRPAAAFHA